jgi:hypothetical protein
MVKVKTNTAAWRAQLLWAALTAMISVLLVFSAFAITATQRVEAAAAAPATSCYGACNPTACPQSIGEICNCISSSCIATSHL